MHTIVISTTGESFTLPHNAHLSDAAELQLGGLEFGCRAGNCGICVIEFEAGIENVTQPERKESDFLAWLGHGENSKRRLACQCRLLGNIVIRQC